MVNSLTSGQHAVDIDGVSLSYHVAGQGPMCLVHPGGPGFSWQYLRMPGKELHERIPGSRLVVLEDSGHLGHLEQPDEFTEAVVDFVC